MNRITLFKSLSAAAFALGALSAATAAHARNDVQFSVTLGSPGFYVQPVSDYVHPRPVYVQPAPVYVQPRPVYERPAPVYVRPRAPVFYQSAPVYGWGHKRHHHDRDENARGPWGDYDRDGTPNRYDRYPGNPNRR